MPSPATRWALLPKSRRKQQQQQRAAGTGARQGARRTQPPLAGRRLEALVLERLDLPEQVAAFGEFEEQSKSYAIERPYVARTQIELLFDVYDGRRLSGARGNSLDGNLVEGSKQSTASALDTNEEDANVGPTSLPATKFVAGAPPKRRVARPSSSSWCRLLFGRKRQRLLVAGSCCLTTSDTSQDLGLVSTSTSAGSLALQQPRRHAPQQEPENTDEVELRAEAFGLLGAALATATRVARSREVDSLGGHMGAPLAALCRSDAQTDEVSVCLLDKRSFSSNKTHLCSSSHKFGGGAGPDGSGLRAAENGRLWARANGRLAQLRRKLRRSAASKEQAAAAAAGGKPEPDAAAAATTLLDERLVEQVARRTSRALWRDLLWQGGRDKQVARASNRRARLNKDHLQQLVELAKSSLNQLIDAQLLLRNKLGQAAAASQQQQDGSLLELIMQSHSGAEYETLLRNNFNLLKIWQNLEETKRLVCFVCEPILANLADLFWFNRHRFDWAAQVAFEAAKSDAPGAASNGNSGAGPLSSYEADCARLLSGKCLLFASPLVCLDAVQVKRGLLQILEALNFLHTVCKLVHRNLNPQNVLLAPNDTWKLSGLEFAVRFESTTISDSKSVMAHEIGQSALASAAPLSMRANCSSAAGNVLRRQRTLHQTKCQEFVRKPAAAATRLLQPDVDYSAPEIVLSAKCSHKSDLFSFGLLVGQVYDLREHRAPISCKSEPASYELELKKLQERRKLRLASAAPFEMRAALLAMLDAEPNARPSANYVLQLLKRPIELCNSAEDSLRHLKSALGYLDATARANNNNNAGGGSGGLMASSVSAAANNNTAQPAAATSAAPTNGGGNNNTNNNNSAAANQTNNINNPNDDGKLLAAAAAASPLNASKRFSYFRRVTSAAAQREPRGRQTGSLHLLNLLVRAVDAALACELDASGAAGNGPHPRNGRPQRRRSFKTLKRHFELTLETLGQVLKSALVACDSAQQHSRTLLLAIALHRRLLEQVAGMRAELPPLCRPMCAASQSNAPLDRNWPSASHRALAEAEERLHTLVSKHSLSRLSEALADPLLKLDEFLLVFELVNDLVGFLGQRCRQRFALRSKQLLNELAPVTGALSSSEEDDDDDDDDCELWAGETGEWNRAAASAACAQLDWDDAESVASGHLGGSTNALAAISRAAAAAAGRPSSAAATAQQQPVSAAAPNKMSAHRYSDFEAGSAGSALDTFGRQQLRRPTVAGQPQSGAPVAATANQIKLPTSINITAPSPLGSMRDISRPVQLANGPAGGARHSFAYAPVQTAGRRPQTNSNERILDMASRLSLNEAAAEQSDGGGAGAGDKSHSQLIDELLKTINDDSFNEIIDFNNRFAAAAQHDQLGGGAAPARPKSAIDPVARCAGQSSSPTSTASAGATLSAGGRPRAPSVAGAAASQPSSAFDNVIRRMSTNIVQNFNKMSGASNLMGAGQNQSDSQPQQLAAAAEQGLAIRREKSSTYGSTNNSLYVDNQVPARRHSDNTINVPRIQVGPHSGGNSPVQSSSRANVNQRATASASKLANKWKLSARNNSREASDKLSPNLGGALSYMRRHSSGNTTNKDSQSGHHSTNESNGGLGSHLHVNATSPFKTRSSSNLGLDFLLSNRSMKRRYSAASMLGHQTQRKAENLIDAGMKSVQNMFG